MRIAIHGYGKMGRLIERAANSAPGVEVAVIIDANDPQSHFRSITKADLRKVDAIIDFSHAEAVLPLIKHVATLAKPPAVVIATSGWNKRRADLERLVVKHKLRVMYGANFALATALFMKISEYAAKLLDRVGKGEFDVTISETHHRAKADMPSGTAIHIGELLLAQTSNKKKLIFGNQKQVVKPSELQVASVRSGYNLGEHSVIFDSPDERITLLQQTTNRLAYAQGAVTAAGWLLKQKPGHLYLFDDYINKEIGES